MVGAFRGREASRRVTDATARRSRRRFSIALGVATLPALLAAAAASARTVCPSGCQHTTIQAAINAASSGETILIEPGTYNEALAYGSKSNITLRSTKPWDPTLVVVDAGQVDAVVRAGPGWTIEGMTLRNGSRQHGGGIYYVGDLTVRHCIIENNHAEDSGGAISTITGGKKLVVVDSILRNNTVEDPQGSGSGGGIFSVGPATIVNTRFENNQVLGGSGGGITCCGGNTPPELYFALKIQGSQFIGNSISGHVPSGGAIATTQHSSVVTIARTVIQGNHAIGTTAGGNSRGGGLYTSRGGAVTDTSITSNEAAANAGGGAHGGGAYVGGIVSFSGASSIASNLSAGDGGGLYCSQAMADAQASAYLQTITGNSEPQITNCQVTCAPGAMRACSTGRPGVCAQGMQVCGAVGLWLACTSPAPEDNYESGAECSDGLDNDCDGMTDLDDYDCILIFPVTIGDVPQSGDDGDPVNTFTGELFQRLSPDLDLGGPSGLAFSRSYASGMGAAGISGRMGTNWRHSFEWTLVDGGATVDVTDPQGRRLHFDLVGGVWYLAPGIDVPWRLVEVSGDFYLGDPRNGRIYFFDNQVFTRVEDGHGTLLTLTYTAGALTQVADGLGRALSLTYTPGGKVETVSDGMRTVTFGYSGDDLSSVLDVRGQTATYTYDPGGLLTSWELPRLNSPYTQLYDGSGRVASQTDAESHTHGFAYDTVNLTTTVTDPLLQTMVHTHTLRGELVAVEDETGDVFTLGYDVDHRRNAVHDRLGGTTSAVRDPESGRVVSVTQADGSTTTSTLTPRSVRGILFWEVAGVDYPDGTSESFLWTNAGDLVQRTDRAGRDWFYEYDERGLLLRATNPKGGISTFGYNADGTLASRTDPAGNTTTYLYDPLRRPITMTHADTSTRTFTWDPANRPLTVTDERAKTTTFTYDDNGNLETITDPLTHVTTLGYDNLDRVTSVTDRLGHTASRTFDELGRVATVTDRTGRTTTFGYDARGRLASVTDPATEVWSFAFDDEGIPVSATDPLSHANTFASDDLGRITSATSPLGHTGGVTLDTMGRIATAINAAGETTTLTYDDLGLATLIDEEGLTLGLGRDELGLVTTTTDGNGENWLTGRDAQGRVTSVSDPLARQTTVTYDDRNRPDLVAFPGGLGTLAPTFDAAGNLTQLAYSDGTTLDYTYDDLNRPTGGTGLSLGYDDAGRLIESNGLAMTYDDAGRLGSVTFAPGKTVTYGYDVRGLLETITDWTPGGVTTFGHDAAGRLVTIVRPNGVDTTYAWDDDDRLVGIDEGALASIALVRDAAGRITKATRAVPLPAEASAATAASFAHDAASQVSSPGYSYDALGRRTADPDRTYDWNLDDRLESYTEGGETVSFTYDALGMRLSRTESGVTRGWAWNYGLHLPSPNVEREAGSDLRYYIYTPAGALLYSVEALDDSRRDYHFDEMGNTLFLTDGSGATIASYAYGPYGALLAEAGSADNPFTWQGRWATARMGPSGLHQMRARCYDTTSRRFLSSDPVVTSRPRAGSPYQYALAAPTVWSDPSGLDSTESPASEFASRRRQILEAARARGETVEAEFPDVRGAGILFVLTRDHDRALTWEEGFEALSNAAVQSTATFVTLLTQDLGPEFDEYIRVLLGFAEVLEQREDADNLRKLMAIRSAEPRPDRFFAVGPPGLDSLITPLSDAVSPPPSSQRATERAKPLPASWDGILCDQEPEPIEYGGLQPSRCDSSHQRRIPPSLGQSNIPIWILDRGGRPRNAQ